MERLLSRFGGRTVPARQTMNMLGMRCGLGARGRALLGMNEENMAKVVC
jgi:hypothetical protein